MRSNTKWFLIGGGILVFALLLMWLGGRGTPLAGGSDEILKVTANDWVKGNTGAVVTVVEYGDFQCPACGAYFSLTNQLTNEFPGDQLQFVFRHFPLMEAHPNAIPAALAAEAAGKQGKFWEMYDILFGKQQEWSPLADAKPKFVEYATSLGLNVSQFTTDMDSSELLDKVRAGRSESEKLGLRGTPTFFVNGKTIENPQSYPAFKALIEAAGAKPRSVGTSTATTTL